MRQVIVILIVAAIGTLINVAEMWFIYGLWPNWGAWFFFLALGFVIGLFRRT